MIIPEVLQQRLYEPLQQRLQAGSVPDSSSFAETLRAFV